MKKIYLHIGLEKTGTTSIQEFLHDKRDALKDIGFLYPSEILGKRQNILFQLAANEGNIGTVGFFSDKKLYREKKHLKNILNSSENIILSNEQLSSRLTDINEISKLKGELDSIVDNIEYEIILFLREPKGYFESTYKECCKDVEVNKYDLFYKLCSENRHEFSYLNFNKRLDFQNIINSWSEVFSKEPIVKVYSNKIDILSEFTHVVGVNEVYNPNLDCKYYKNSSISVRFLFVNRIFNRLFKKCLIKNNTSSVRFLIARVIRRNLIRVLSRLNFNSVQELPLIFDEKIKYYQSKYIEMIKNEKV